MVKVANGEKIEIKRLWKELGHYSSYLSALTWTVQLFIFDYACFQEQDDENRILAFLSMIC
jgi:hypothetical protein